MCHKCLVLIENCAEFREKCLKNDEKLRLIFKVETRIEEAQEQAPVLEVPVEAEPIEEEDEEVITLNPNKLYESSDESENENPENQRVLEHHQVQATLSSSGNNNTIMNTSSARAVKVPNKETFHCRYCDIVFPDNFTCANHEQSHNAVHPYECVACPFNTDQHALLISHVKNSHNLEKPYFCSQCTKSFVRRADLRKHSFVHSGKNPLMTLLPALITIPSQASDCSAATSARNHSPATQTSPSTSERTRKPQSRGSVRCVQSHSPATRSCRVIWRFTWIARL